ncbi:MAG TPA: alkene reductase [Gammaproteobacteria bacterium]|jgi:2,4-dienoyl-CoA reductase-like NADH-dependent reductase (Old Yellow Enzyme family)|nr:alkene reductase [Gammaproteobacteria bacterium]
MKSLLSPYLLTPNLLLKNRIIMAPMTRRQAQADHTPGACMIDYYARRSDAGLIITEGVLISADAIGYGNAPGIYTEAHVQAWRVIANAVHRNQGKIFMQLWHCGRISHSQFHQDKAPLSASATIANVVLGSTNLSCSLAREASHGEIHQLISDYANAAKNAIAAGFDGIEIHGANGYLIDQFLHYHTNQRYDEYGLTPENMSRFPLQIIRACGEAIGYDKIGIRLSPAGYLNDILTDQRDKFVFEYFLSALASLNISYVHTGNFNDSIRFSELNNLTMTDFLRTHYDGTLIASGGYTLENAAQLINENKFDLVAMGRSFIANHNLIELLKQSQPIQSYHPDMLQNVY